MGIAQCFNFAILVFFFKLILIQENKKIKFIDHKENLVDLGTK